MGVLREREGGIKHVENIKNRKGGRGEGSEEKEEEKGTCVNTQRAVFQELRTTAQFLIEFMFITPSRLLIYFPSFFPVIIIPLTSIL